MKKGITTETANKNGKVMYWHYHAIGVGFVINYIVSTKQLAMTCEHTGQIIQSADFYDNNGLSREEFLNLCNSCYTDAIDKGTTITLDYFDDPTIVGCIGVDFDLLKN